jgi:hypothetical protein
MAYPAAKAARNFIVSIAAILAILGVLAPLAPVASIANAASVPTLSASHDVVNNLPAPARTVPLSLVYYGIHNAAIDNKILNIGPALLIANTPAGFWHGNCNPAKFQAAGTKVFSYIHGSYSTFSLTQNLAFLDAIAAEGSYGAFLDELRPEADSYLQTIYARCQQLGIKLMVNPGMSSIDPEVYRYADFVVTDERYAGRDPAPPEAANLDKTIVIGFNSGMTAAEAAAYSNTAWAHGFRYTWHEQVEYVTLPSQTWLTTYTRLLTPPGGAPAAAGTAVAEQEVRPYVASSAVAGIPGIPWAGWAQAASISIATISAGWSALLAWRRRLQHAIALNDPEAV